MNTSILEGNWDQIKGKLKHQWSKLSNDDIESIEGSYDKLQGKLKKAYGYTKDEIKDQIETFLEENDFAEEAESLKNSLLGNARYLRDRIEQIYENTTDELGKLKERTQKIEKEVVSYAKENPKKSLGFAVALGLIAALLLKK